MISKIPTPESFFGFVPGTDRKMIRWDRLCEYYDTLNSLSDRMVIEEAGLSSEGNRFIFIYVSSPENIKNLEKYREISEKLADPEGLSEDEISALCDEGKAVCMQQYGLHSNEVGGPQMVPIMLHELVAGESEKISRILDNVIFIIAPCSEPDGEIIFTDYYNKHLGTECEGAVSPFLRHNWAGHSNNRDGVREIVRESQHINDVLVRRWHPQVFQDHHHQCPWEDRMTIAPNTDPYFDPICPLVIREAGLYGAYMAQALSAAGRKGVVTGGDFFDGFNISSYSEFAKIHNTTGMLTENADVSIATPVTIGKELLSGCYLKPSVHCPDPWEGGEWHLSDIVDQMHIASVALLEYLSMHRRETLACMAQKAKLQTERGKNSADKFYIIPPDQHDRSASEVLLKLLHKQGIKMYASTEMFRAGSAYFPKGTVVVPAAQPKYAAVMAYLHKNPYTVIPSRLRPDGSQRISDSANVSFALCMGVEVLTCGEDIDKAILEKFLPDDRVECIMSPFGYDGTRDNITLPLPACENLSYKHANLLLASGKKLFRNEAGDFTENEGIPVRRSRIGLLKKSATWNEEEGFTRSLLKMYSFDFRILLDKEIRENGVPQDIDVVIIPGDDDGSLSAGDVRNMKMPIEFHSGLGSAGAAALREFVNSGGRLVAWEKTCAYVNRIFNLGINIPNCSRAELSTNGSVLKGEIKADKLTRGMPKKFNLTHNDGPMLLPTDRNGTVQVIARLDGEKTFVNGYVRGEDRLCGTPCVLRAARGDGEIILYSFNPEFRNQNDSTFKLLFNALYEE